MYLTPRLVATHDHWFIEPPIKHAIPGLRLRWHGLVKREAHGDTHLFEAMESTATGAIALLLLLCELAALGMLAARL